jgi:integrase
MAAKRSGTIISKPSGFFARVWVTLPEGKEERRWLNLQTTSRATAKRKLARMISMMEAGEFIAEAHAKSTTPESYREFTTALHEKRERAGIVMARDEKRNRENFIYPLIGDLPVARVTDDHVRQVLEEARDKGLAWESVRKIRAVMSRDFKRARIEKLITISPVQDVGIPEGLRKDKRPRVILTDEEVGTFLSAPKGDIELKMVSLVARTEGGMRTAELLRWDWSMIDTATFAACTIARAKTGEIQRLEVPEVLRPFLLAWWTRHGKPASGPVFPSRRGRTKGQAKKVGATTFAHRLRRDLFRAGVRRLPPVEVEVTSTPNGKGEPKGTKLEPNPADPLFFDTRSSRKVDFHSFRRAYNTALARAGVNIQQAMVLASHSDAKTHMGYVMAVEATRPVPAAALPALPAAALACIQSPVVTLRDDVANDQVEQLGESATDSSYARRDSNPRHAASKAAALSS